MEQVNVSRGFYEIRFYSHSGEVIMPHNQTHIKIFRNIRKHVPKTMLEKLFYGGK